MQSNAQKRAETQGKPPADMPMHGIRLNAGSERDAVENRVQAKPECDTGPAHSMHARSHMGMCMTMMIMVVMMWRVVVGMVVIVGMACSRFLKRFVMMKVEGS